MRPRSGLRVVLHAERRQRLVPDPFNCIVIKIDVRQFKVGGKVRQREVVVLAGDRDFPGQDVFHGVTTI